MIPFSSLFFIFSKNNLYEYEIFDFELSLNAPFLIIKITVDYKNIGKLMFKRRLEILKKRCNT